MAGARLEVRPVPALRVAEDDIAPVVNVQHEHGYESEPNPECR